MPTVDESAIQETLDSLRVVRRQLFAILESELNAMSLDDQVKYGDSLHQYGLAILKLETAKIKGVNDQFKEKEDDLKKAAGKLESDAAELENTVAMIRAISEGVKLVTNIVDLLD